MRDQKKDDLQEAFLVWELRCFRWGRQVYDPFKAEMPYSYWYEGKQLILAYLDQFQDLAPPDEVQCFEALLILCDNRLNPKELVQ